MPGFTLVAVSISTGILSSLGEGGIEEGDLCPMTEGWVTNSELQQQEVANPWYKSIESELQQKFTRAEDFILNLEEMFLYYFCACHLVQ